MLGRYVSDLAEGDQLLPVTYELTPFMVREYCHGVGEHAEEFHRPVPGIGAQLVPLPMVHIDKIRLINANCPEGPGPNARIHYEFRAQHHRLTPVGESLTTSGSVVRRYGRKGRTHLDLEIEVRIVNSGELVVSYLDTAILNYAPAKG